MIKTILGLLGLGAAAAGVGFWVWNARWDEKPAFRTLPVERGELLLAVRATGTVEPVEVIDVGAQIIGRIKRFGPDEERPGKTIDYCSRVKAGAVLAQLDDAPTQAELEKAEAALKLAQAELKRNEAQFAQAEREFNRAKLLKDTNSESEYDRAQAQYEIATAELAFGNARVEQAGVLRKQASINLGYTTIQAPIDGILIDRRVNVGQTVVAGLNAPSLFLLAKDLSRMQVWAAVNEADIADIRIGQKVTFKVDAHRDRTFEGVVSQIRLNAGMSNNVVSYGVVVTVDNQDGVLMPYMTANLQFEVARRTDVLLVPNQALRWRPTWALVSPVARERLRPPETEDDADLNQEEVAVPGSVLWTVADDGLLRPVPVTLGLTNGMVTEITSGEVDTDSPVVVGVARRAKRDFVSSFVSRVTGSGKAK